MSLRRNVGMLGCRGKIVGKSWQKSLKCPEYLSFENQGHISMFLDWKCPEYLSFENQGHPNGDYCKNMENILTFVDN